MAKSQWAWVVGAALTCCSTIFAGRAEDDLINLARSNVDEGVLLTYIDKAPAAYSLSADNIITLKDMGVSSKVITAALRHMRTQGTPASAPSSAVVKQGSQAAAPVPQQSGTPSANVNITVTSDDSLTVNIPAANGGITPVVLKRSGEGFIGPQGEYYPQFPQISQLKVMYGK